MHIKDIFLKQTKFWIEQNIEFFGVSPREWLEMSPKEIEHGLELDTSLYWNGYEENHCEMARLVYSGKICRNNEDLVPGSIVLKMNAISGCIDIYGDFDLGVRKYEGMLIASIPSPCPDLTWVINKIKYTPRISAYRDYNLVTKGEDGIVRHPGVWTYDTATGRFTILNKRGKTEPATEDPFSTLSPRSVDFLQAFLGEELTRDNFEEAMSRLPVLNRSSVYLYGFTHLDLFFDLIRMGNRFANPIKNIQLGVNTIFMKQNMTFDVSDKLVASQSPIFSLENFRTVVYKPKAAGNNSYVPSFAFTDTVGLFDAFKTTTNDGAGRHRMLLDNVYCEGDTLYVASSDGEVYNMFDILAGKYVNKSHISAISSSPFCNNNDPKRIMMTSKLSAQSVPVTGQQDIFTNRVRARVVFGDFEGWSFADSILISESFAKKLTSREILQVDVTNKSALYDLKEQKEIGDTLDLKELRALFPAKNILILKNYETVTIKNIEVLSDVRYKLTLEAVIPFNDGDKITNLHGSKGVVGKIIPDEEMPRLKNPIGSFEAGPFEVIISGYSVLRRGSLGQILEAWANASGINFETGQDFATNAVKQCAEEMKEFTRQSVIEFRGTETIKPCGEIDMIRLYHHATTKASLSPLKKNSVKMLNLGNQEKLNLAATGKFDVLKELSIRSTRKHDKSLWHIHNIMKHRALPENPKISSNFARILKSTGLSLEIEGQELVESDNTTEDISNIEYEKVISEVSNDDIIDLDKLYGGSNDE